MSVTKVRARHLQKNVEAAVTLGGVAAYAAKMPLLRRIPLPLPFVVVTVALASSACESTSNRAERSAPQATAPEPPTAVPAAMPSGASPLTLVTDPSLVCMVNNQFMGRPQIPVQVSGKTYYGCCAMCKARLEGDATARTALDPVTQTPVDKASAVIGTTPTGAALYFASREHFDAYARLSQFHCHANRGRVNSAFRSRIGNAMDASRCHGTDIDDGTGLLGSHDRDDGAAAP